MSILRFVWDHPIVSALSVGGLALLLPLILAHPIISSVAALVLARSVWVAGRNAKRNSDAVSAAIEQAVKADFQQIRAQQEPYQSAAQRIFRELD